MHLWTNPRRILDSPSDAFMPDRGTTAGRATRVLNGHAPGVPLQPSVTPRKESPAGTTPAGRRSAWGSCGQQHRTGNFYVKNGQRASEPSRTGADSSRSRMRFRNGPRHQPSTPLVAGAATNELPSGIQYRMWLACVRSAGLTACVALRYVFYRVLTVPPSRYQGKLVVPVVVKS